jgi:hypothetical protein
MSAKEISGTRRIQLVKPITKKTSSKKKTSTKKKSQVKRIQKKKVIRKPSQKQLTELKRQALDQIPVDEMGVADQFWLANQKDNRGWAIFSAIFAGSVPISTYLTAHYDMINWSDPKKWLVISGLVFSCITVLIWARNLFRSSKWYITWFKAIAFVSITEGIMVTSGIAILSYTALALLVVANMIATGVNISQYKWKWSTKEK